MSNIIETFEHANCTIEILWDDEPFNPRTEWDNLGTMVCEHNRYDLGDADGRARCLEDIRNSPQYRESWEYDHKGYWKGGVLTEGNLYDLHRAAERCGFIILPLYLYDHSGITMNTTGFSCPWDSGQVGFIYVTPEQVRKEYSVKRISKDLRERVLRLLKGEVEVYDRYLTGQVYGYEVKHNGSGDEDSCWGIMGDMSYVKNEAEAIAEYMDRLYQRDRQAAIKGMVRNHVPLQKRQKKLATLYPV